MNWRSGGLCTCLLSCPQGKILHDTQNASGQALPVCRNLVESWSSFQSQCPRLPPSTQKDTHDVRTSNPLLRWQVRKFQNPPVAHGLKTAKVPAPKDTAEQKTGRQASMRFPLRFNLSQTSTWKICRTRHRRGANYMPVKNELLISKMFKSQLRRSHSRQLHQPINTTYLPAQQSMMLPRHSSCHGFKVHVVMT